MHKLKWLTAIVFVLSLILSGAIFAQDDPGGDTYIRFAHFNPNVEGVDVYINGEETNVTDFGFDTVSEWIELEPGAYDIDVTAAGDSIDNAAVSLDDFQLPLGQFTTAVVVSDNEGTPAIVAAAEDYDVLPAAASRVTFVNALSTQESVNFLRNGVPFATSLGQNAEQIDSYSLTVPVDSGIYDFSVTTSVDESALDDLQDVEILDGNSYMFFAHGTLEDGVTLTVDETEAYEIAILQDELEEPGTLINAVNSNDALVPYAAAIESAGLTDALNDEAATHTVFLPAGFLYDEVVAAVGDDTELLASYLRNHTVEGDVRVYDLLRADSVTTLDGIELPVTVQDNALFIGGARLIVANIAANNGTIHVIGNIINPETAGPVFTEDDINLMDDADFTGNMESGFGVEEDDEMMGEATPEMTPEVED